MERCIRKGNFSKKKKKTTEKERDIHTITTSVESYDLLSVKPKKGSGHSRISGTHKLGNIVLNQVLEGIRGVRQ